MDTKREVKAGDGAVTFLAATVPTAQRLGGALAIFPGARRGGHPRRVVCQSPSPQLIQLSDQARERMYLYADGLADVLEARRGGPLDPCYMRFPDRALRGAALMASVSESATVELHHWARAQTIVERWRAGLHHLWDQLHEGGTESRAERLQEQILAKHTKAGEPLSIREATRGWRSVSWQEIAAAYESLVAVGDLVEHPTPQTIKYAPPGAENPAA